MYVQFMYKYICEHHIDTIRKGFRYLFNELDFIDYSFYIFSVNGVVLIILTVVNEVSVLNKLIGDHELLSYYT